MTEAIRPHIGLAATNVAATIAFYRSMFGIEPSKVKPGYAKFEVKDPALNLSINAAETVAERDSSFHMGIELANVGDVNGWKARVQASGLTVVLEEERVTCCYSVQDKFWLADPDGHRWEIFVVHEDADIHGSKSPAEAEPDACCPPTCCQ